MIGPQKLEYVPRYIEEHVKEDLARKMVFLAGPRAEVQSHLYVALDQGYVRKAKFGEIYVQAYKTAKIISDLHHINQTNEINETNQKNQINQTNQMNQTNQINEINQINQTSFLAFNLAPFLSA